MFTNHVGSKSTAPTIEAGVVRRAEVSTYDERNTFFVLTRTLHTPIRTRRAQSHNRLKKSWPSRKRFSRTCRRPLRIAVLHSCHYFSVSAGTFRVFTGFLNLSSFPQNHSSKFYKRSWSIFYPLPLRLSSQRSYAGCSAFANNQGWPFLKKGIHPFSILAQESRRGTVRLNTNVC